MYISNLMKAHKSFGKTTSIGTFEKKLLRGDVFANVEAIERPGLEERCTGWSEAERAALY